MNKALLSIVMLGIGGLLNIGCMNQAAVSVKDGHYEGNARSTNPEALLDTVSRNRARETYAQAYSDAVANGGAYPYGMVGPVGDYRQNYCPNGMCISPVRPPVMAPPPPTAPKAAPKATPAPNDDPAQKPVTREDLEKVRAQAADAQQKANVSIGILKTVRTEKDKPKEVAPAAPPPPPPSVTPAPKPMSQQEIDEVNRRAEEARKNAEAASAPAKQP